MKHNGKTRNFTLPVVSEFPDPDDSEMVVMKGNESIQDGLYIFIDPNWRWIKSEIGDQYDFPVTVNKFFARRSSDFVINSTVWSPLALPVIDFKDTVFSHTPGSSEVIINKRSRYTIECEFSAQRSSGSNVPFGVRLSYKPANGDACTLVNVWQPQSIYLAGSRVQYNGVLYEANWYSQNQRPDQNSAQYQVWTNLGSCKDGPASFQVIPGSYSNSVCSLNGIPSAFVRAGAELSVFAGSSIRAEVATLGSGSVTMLADSFRFRISEG